MLSLRINEEEFVNQLSISEMEELYKLFLLRRRYILENGFTVEEYHMSRHDAVKAMHDRTGLSLKICMDLYNRFC